MNRRTLLRGISAAGLWALLGGHRRLGERTAKAAEVLEPPAIPILMFHKVMDAPRSPEDISTMQLTQLLRHAWDSGFCPVNISDILTDQVDNIVPKGKKPLGITADDAHPSMIFSSATVQRGTVRNARSFVEILGESVAPHGYAPRATFFISHNPQAPQSTGPVRGYFGESLPLVDILDALAAMPGVEMGYHTLTHTRMGGMSSAQVQGLLEAQMRQFRHMGIFDRIARILAYPFGVVPSEQGRYALVEMGFLGAVLAFPGVREARYADIPRCVYDGRLMTDMFLIPRVCIGARTYAYGQSARAGAHSAIEPLDDFHKDVELALPNIYISRGAAHVSAAQPTE